MMRLEEIVGRLEGVKPSGDGYIAKCPAHDDGTPSLSISEGENGTILAHCFAGCEFDEIVAAIGLEMQDFSNANGRDQHPPRSRPVEQPIEKTISLPIPDGQIEKLHLALTPKMRKYLRENRVLSDSVIDRYQLGFENRGGRRITIPVHDSGAQVIDIRRWLSPEQRKTDDDKKILHWKTGFGAARLYPIDELVSDELVLTEGELDALALNSHSIPAITATCGASTWPDSLSEPFRGKRVTVLMDHDVAGQRGAEKRAESLSRHGAEVLVADWPEDREEGWDVTDELREYGLGSVKQILAEATSIEPDSVIPILDDVPVPPLQAMAGPLRRLVEEGAKSKQCPPDFVVVPLLVSVGAAIGNSRTLRLKSDWQESACLFAAVVADPGTAKTPAMALATRPVFNREEVLRQRYEEEMQEYDVESAQWDQGDKQNPKPPEPNMARALIDNATVEAIVEVLAANPRGVILLRDELSGWVDAMGSYKGGKGDDRQFFLSVWSGSPRTVDRKTRNKPVFLKRPFLAVTGMIQPDVVQDMLREDRRDDGFVDRLLFACPDAAPPERWVETEVSFGAVEEVQKLFERLYGLEGVDGEPGEIRLEGGARGLWIKWYENHQEEARELPIRLRGAWSKMPSQCARLILIMHLSRWGAGEDVNPGSVDAQSVAWGTAWAEFFKSHARRVHGILRESEEQKRLRKVVEWIRGKGNRGVTVTAVARSEVTGSKKHDVTREVLGTLVERGEGFWRKPERKASGQQGAEEFFLVSNPTPRKGL